MAGINNRFDVVDVVIVGLGPSGATLANLLGLQGHKVLILEREACAYHLPRAVHFDEEVMRVFQTIGLAHRVNEVARVNPGMKFVDADGQLLLDWPRPSGRGPGGWQSSYRFHQPDLERVLRSGLDRFVDITVRSQSEFSRYVDRDDGVQVFYTDLATGKDCAVDARYLIGCDGGRSTVKAHLQTDNEDFGFRESWLVVDVLLNEPMEQLGDYTIQYCHPQRPATYVRCPDNRRRWEMAMPSHASAEEMTRPDSVWRSLEAWLTPEQATLERAAVYTFHSTIAQRWRRGRVLIAGDAAHQMPPFMGQGMCAGIRDAANLGWKLNRCIDRGHNGQLLDSYQSERYPHVAAYIETAIRLGTLLRSCDSGEALRSARSVEDGKPTMKSIAPRLGSGLAAEASIAAGGVVDANAGMLSTQAIIGAVMLDDIVGYNPVLLIDDQLLQSFGVDALADVPELKVEPVNGQSAIAAILNELDTAAVLIRPDRYIYGCAETAEGLSTLLNSAKRMTLL